ncbi:hypothetical protein KA047_00675 [Candidatus Saccharibacteria bacterium]|nr:hypothetical protein [Candidatus Saccharibacteria bacterium]
MNNIRLKKHWWKSRKVQICVLALIVAVTGVSLQLYRSKTYNSTGINEQLNFQARLLDDTGAVVPDGFYNLRFKVYQDGDGCEVSGTSPCGGTLEWTETRDSTNKVRVKNGYFSVYLGSVTAFSTNVDWNQDSLWLSIDVGGTGSPSWDGEMLPFTRFSATPYAKNAKRLGGLTKDEIVQLGQGTLQVDASSNDSIGINKTGASGDILQLQRGGSDVLVIDNAGSLLFKPQTDAVTALQVKNAAGSATIFDIDTTNKRVGINNAAPTASLQVQGTSASEIVSVIQGNSAAQTGDLQRYLNSSSEVMGRVDAGGNIVAALDPPASALTATASATAGNLNGTYTYVVTYTTFAGETLPGPTSSSVAPASKQVDLTAIPTGPAGTKSRKIYRTTRQVDGVTTGWRFLTEIADNTTTVYTDDTADTSLTYAPPMPIAPPQVGPRLTSAGAGALTGNYSYVLTYVTPWGETAAGPVSNTFAASSNGISLKEMPFGGVKNVSAMRVYRTQSGGSTYYYNPTLRLTGTATDTSGTITDPSVSQRDDNNGDGSLNTNIKPPTSENTANRPAAPSASLITSAGNLTQNLKYVWAYSYVNASGAESALSTMSGTVTPDGTGQQASLTSISAGPPGTVARKIYRSFLTPQNNILAQPINDNVTGPFMLVGTIANNSTTTYTDNTADNQLTVNRPQKTGFVGAGIITNNIKLAAPQGTPPITVTSTSLVENLNVEYLGGNDQQGIKDFTYNVDESLKHFRGALANANSEAVVVNFIGDSITWGLAGSDRAVKSTPALVEKALKEKYGDGGTGFQKPWDNRLFTQGSTGAYVLGNGGAAGGAISMCNAASGLAELTINFRGNKLDIQYTESSFLGLDSFYYNIDGGAATGTVTTNGATLSYGNRANITDLDPQKTHTLSITVPDDGNGGNGYECVNLEGIDAMFDTGVRVNNLATSSTYTVGTFNAYDAAIGAFDPRPDLVVFAYGTNEQGTSTTPQSFKQSYQKWIGQAKASSDPADCVLVVPAPQTGDSSASFDVQAYRDVIYQLADENGCGVMDLWRKWGGDFDWAQSEGFYNNGAGGAGTIDGLHLSDKGNADVASTLIGFLDRGVKLNNTLAVDTSYTQNGGSFSISELAAPSDLRQVSNKAVSDGTLTSGNTFRYRVTAINTSGESNPSDEKVFTVTTTNALNADNIIPMTWNSVPGATKYRVYRCPTANCSSGTSLSQYVEVTRSSLVDDGTLSWVTNVAPPSSAGNSSFSGALLQGAGSTAFAVANSDGANVIRVDTSANQYNLIANSGFEGGNATNLLNNPSFETDSGNWEAKGAGSIGYDGTYVYDKSKSMVLTTTAAANDGAKYNKTLPNSTSYELTFWARTVAGSGSVLAAGYANDGSTESNCTLNSSSISTTWAQYHCVVTTTTVSGTPYLYIKQSDATARYIVVDKVSFKPITAPTGWAVKGSASRVYQTDAQRYAGAQSLKADTTAAAGDGIKYPITLASSTQYSMSFKARANPIMFGTIAAGYSSDGSTETDCTLNSTLVAPTGWLEVTCTFTTGTVSGTPYLYIEQSDTTARSIYIDSISLVPGSSPLSYTAGTLALDGTITSALLLRNAEDSPVALQVQNAAGTSLFSVSTTLSTVNITAALSVTGDTTMTGNTTVSGNLTADTINIGATSPVASGLEVIKNFTSTSSCTLGCYGAYISSTVTDPANPSAALGLRVGTGTGAASFTLATAYGIYVDPVLEGAGSTVTNAYGGIIKAQALATNNYGLAIESAGTQTLWLASEAANPTSSTAGIAFGTSRDTNLYRGAADQLKSDDALNLVTTSASALLVQSASAAETVMTVDTAARSGSGGNLVKIGNSTGTDTATTILQLDGTTADPTSNLSALNGGLFYDSTLNKVKIIENGVVKTVCNTTDAGCGAGGSGARLDQITAATAGASINNADNNVVWNWQLSAAESGFTFTENTASTGGGAQNQFITDIATLPGSTASPLRVTSASVDAADIVFNLASAGDIEFQDNGTAFMTLSDAGAYSYTLDATDNPAYTITNSGSGNVVTNLAGTGDFIVQDNGTAVFTISDSGNIDTAYASTNTTAATEYSLKVTVTDTGVVTTGTDNTYGQQISVGRSGATGGTLTTVGLDISASTDTAGAGTATVYGVRSLAGGNAFGSADYIYGSSGIALGVAGGSVVKAVGVDAGVTSVFFGGSMAEAYALQGTVNMAGGGTVTTAAGLQINSAAINSASIAANYGIKVDAQTVGTTDFGVRIDAADTQTLWLSGNADNTTASAGIAFGSSRDTTLYRSDVATLATDGTLKVGNTTNAGGIDIYGEITRKGITQQTGLTGINDVFIYDITADSDGGAWADSEASQGLSWYNESKDDGYNDACNIASDDRCGDSRFPRKAMIVATNDAVYIFDAVSQKLFTKFTQAGTYSLGVDTNNNPSSVFALNGVVYVGTNGSAATGMYAIDFANDRFYNYDTTDRAQGDKDIANRNTTVTYATDTRTAMAIRHNAVNAVHGAVMYGSSSIETNGGPLNGATFIAAATDDSMSVINLTAQQTLDYGDNLTDQFSSVFVTRRGRLYGLNVTLGQLERYGTQANGTVGIDVAKADQATPTDVYDEQAANLPNLSKTVPTFTVGAPDALKVLERGSLADDAADRIYVGHSQGMTEIHDVNAPSATVIGWSQFVKKDGTTMHMSGNNKGMFRFDETTGDLTDDTRQNSILEPEVAPTYGVPGVRGTALRFDGTSQFLCSDANNDGTCDTDADFNVAAISSHIKVWFKHSTTITGTDVLVDRRFTTLGGTEGIGYTIEMNASGQMVYGIQDTAATAGYDDSVTSTQSYNDNQWHYLVAVNTDTGICLFVDGKLAVACDTTLAATGTLDASQILTIGADASGASGGNFWDGDIDDVYFAGGGSTTSSNQTQAQIRKQYLAGRSALSRPSTRVTAATTFSSTTIGDSGESYVPNSFVGSFVEITSGTGAGQTRRITSNNGTTFTVTPAWSVTPDTSSDFEVMPESLYGSTDTVTSIGMSDANAFIGTSRNLYIGTNDGAGGGGVTAFGGYGNEYVTDLYHSDAGVTDSLGNAWTGADADDIDAIDGDNGNLVFGTGANLWRVKFDRNVLQELDSIIGNLGSVRAELIVDGLLGTSTETGNIGGADLAERFISNDSLVPGDIVSMQDNSVGEVVPTSKPYDDKVLGIVATEPGLIIGPQEENSYPIALSGRVPAKVMFKPGESIKSGDRITSSTVAGYGMKAVNAGRVVGTALEDLNPETLIECPDGSPEGARCGTVMVFVNLVDYNGQKVEVAMEEFGDGGFTMPDTVLGPLVNLQDDVLSEKLKKSDDIIRYLLGRKQQQAPGEDNSEILTDRVSAYEINGVSINAKDITADSIKANKIEGLEVLVGKLTSRPKTTTEAGESNLAEASVNLDDFVVKTAKVGESLTVEGALFANGALKVAGPVEFLSTSIFHRMATFVDSVIFRNDVEIEGRLTQNSDAAGFATIYKTQKKVEIEFEKPYEDTPVVTVNIKNGKFAQFVYDDLTREGFTIILPEGATEDIEFAWTAVSIKDAKTTDVPLSPAQ